MKLEELRKKLRPESKTVELDKFGHVILRDEAGRPCTPVGSAVSRSIYDDRVHEIRNIEITLCCGRCKQETRADGFCQTCEDRDHLLALY